MPQNPLNTVWFYSSISGSVISELALGDTIQAHLPGWHGPFPTKQAALNYYQQNKAAHPDWKAPTGLAGAVTNTVTSGVSGTADFLSRLAAPNTWLRVAEVALGLILIAVGVARLTGTQNAVSSIVKARIP
jgi:hypothetical protein